jgi:hypothetical protein
MDFIEDFHPIEVFSYFLSEIYQMLNYKIKSFII